MASMLRRGGWSLLAGLAMVTAACGNGGTPAEEQPVPLEDQTLTISNWDAYMPEDLIPRFEAETGVEVTLAIHTTNEDIMGKLEAQGGEGFDLVFVSGPFAQILRERGWAAELDHAQIPNLANLYPEAMELGYDPGNRYSVPYAWGTTGLCYRSDLVHEEPDTWMDLLDPAPELRGKVTMLGTDRWLLQPALLALGYSINTTDPAEIEEAVELTIRAKQHLLAFDDTTFYSRLVSGEAWLVHAWDGWCNYAIAEDPDVRFVVPEEGSDLWTDTMVVLASSENKEAAHAFIDFVLRPENGKAVSELVLYKVPNRPAMESVDPEILRAYPNLRMSPSELLAFEPELDLGEGISLWSDAVARIKAA